MIIGLTGTFGAGKGTVGEILQEKGFKQLVMSDVIREECRKEGIEENRDNLIAMGNKLRETFGPDVITKRLLEKVEKEGYDKVIIDGLRSTGEVDELKKAKGRLIVVDAPREIRYERIKKRGSSKDNITFEEFKKQEEKEKGKKDIQTDKCIEIADYKIDNSGTIEELKKKVEEVLAELV